MYTCAVNAMQMVTEDMRVDMVTQERDMELHRDAPFRSRTRKRSWQRWPLSLPEYWFCKGAYCTESFQNYVDYCIYFFTQNVEIIHTYIFIFMVKRF